MFYSQFILAKKGPLGTIWIAAHLERKLRKNQVADTDIGVSVDSILSPDVPIALRLSSHLLLGVVRIYSKKVNYLFDDCSEALLKIKQAFRSAAVDLPPEESKAPYHSITLPETFDLDDFELPDNDIFHGNFVDHHISSREQITLQDTMEGVSYSTSKFGLDERFGDGDASGLDLDEELFLNKIDSAGHANESSDPQASSVLTTLVIPKDEQPETRAVNSRILVDLDLEDDGDHMDYAQAPCTPGLVDEPNLSNAQEVSAFDDHLESECHFAGSTVEKTKNDDGDKQEFDWCLTDKISDATPVVEVKENDDQPVDVENDLSKQHGESPTEAKVEDVSVDGSSPGANPISASLDKELKSPSELVDKMLEASDGLFSDGLQNGSTAKDTDSALPVTEPHDDYQGSHDLCLEKSAPEVPGQIRTSEQEKTSTDKEKLSQIASSETEFLLSCQSKAQQPDSCGARSNDLQIDDAVLATSGGEELQGKACQISHITKEYSMGNHVEEEDLHASSREPEGEVHNEDSRDKQVENQDKPAEAECPAPEKLLSAPVFLDKQHQNLIIDESPGGFVGLDEGDAGSKNISGKKRSFTESTLTEQSLNSVESSRLVQFKSTVGSVPDDDDLLSSILAGRSSVLKVKPTPRLSEATSVKRTRLTSRTVTPKRKVLMDDTMVLHGDTIRQQLTNTEDIRRVRKKAPCTLTEISMIQKQHLEDENFLGSTFTGVSSQLLSLHNQVWNLRRITVFKSDFFDDAFGQTVVETGLHSEKDEKAVSSEPNLTSHNDKNDDLFAEAEQTLPSETAENGQTLNTKIMLSQREHNVTEQSDVMTTGEFLVDGDNLLAEQIVDAMTNEGGIKETLETNVVNGQGAASGHVEPDSLQELLPGENGVETIQKEDDAVARDASDVVQEVDINKTDEANASPKTDLSSVLPQEEAHAPLVELEYTPMDIDNEQAINSLFMDKDSGIDATLVEPEPLARDDFLSSVNDGRNVELFSNAEHEDIVGSMYPDDGFMNNGENPEKPGSYQNYMMNPDHPGFDLHEQEELNYYGAGNDTEFLNVDDDELADMADDQDPDDEEARFAENTGWSSRTRAVSKYLQTLFIKEAEHGRKSLSTDNLLVGKTRKEASRMFFEALVLKTRDYIHVEQKIPFDDITIKPRARLLKSDF